MEFYLLCSVALGLVLTPFWFGLLPPPTARSLIRFRQERCHVRGDALPPHVLSSVAEILQHAGVKRGFIAITQNQRVKFSRTIPKTIHQCLRNVVLNP